MQKDTRKGVFLYPTLCTYFDYGGTDTGVKMYIPALKMLFIYA